MGGHTRPMRKLTNRSSFDQLGRKRTELNANDTNYRFWGVKALEAVSYSKKMTFLPYEGSQPGKPVLKDEGLGSA